MGLIGHYLGIASESSEAILSAHARLNMLRIRFTGRY
jgi:hypothetical protein